MAVESQPGPKNAGGTAGASQLAGGVPFWSAGKSSADSRKIEPLPHSVLDSPPIMLAVLCLVLLTLLISSVEYRHWSSAAGNVPIARDVLAFIRSHGSPLPQDNVKVWTKQQFGFYYCQGEVLFGRKPGKMMTQSEALLSGYRPVHEQYCAGSEPREASKRSAPSRSPQHGM